MKPPAMPRDGQTLAAGNEEFQCSPTEEERALITLADEYGPVLVQFFRRRVPDRSEAEDLKQEVFMRLLQRGNIAQLDDVRAYLFETAANVLRDRGRRRATRRSDRHDEFDPVLHAEKGFSAERVIIGEEALTKASRALLELPERARTIFILRRLEGLRYQDIAQRLGVSVSLVEKEMSRSIAYLAQRMVDE